MTQHHSQKCGGGGVSRERADRIVKEQVIRRVRFTFGANTEFASAGDAWEQASLEDKRRALTTVLDRVVIEPRAPREAVTARRRLRIEWKPEFTGEQLVAHPSSRFLQNSSVMYVTAGFPPIAQYGMSAIEPSCPSGARPTSRNGARSKRPAFLTRNSAGILDRTPSTLFTEDVACCEQYYAKGSGHSFREWPLGGG